VAEAVVALVDAATRRMKGGEPTMSDDPKDEEKKDDPDNQEEQPKDRGKDEQAP
jgi:hypothetical protein